MNPYSFKRFLENPGRPRHPIQLVRAGSNRIIVQGDLPDCVRNGDTGMVATEDDISASHDTHGCLSYQHHSHRPNLLQTTPLDDPFVPVEHRLDELHPVDVVVDDDHSGVFPNPTCSHLPDIHLCTASAEMRSNPNLGDSEHMPPHEATGSRTPNPIPPPGLPDFLPNVCVENETSAPSRSYTQSARPLPRSVHTLSLQSTSLPTLLVGLGENRSVSNTGLMTTVTTTVPSSSSSKSHEQLSSRISRHGGQITSSSIGDRVSHLDELSSEPMPRNEDSASGHPWSTHTTPSHSSQADPFIDAHPISLSGSITSPDPRFLNQQERLEALAVRLDETEQELREARRLLREQTQLLYNVRAESEVVRREADVRVKALEHELAAEKLRSAKDRLLALQLRGQLASMRQTTAQTPTDLSPQSPEVQSAGSFERVCSSRTTTTTPSVQPTTALGDQLIDASCPDSRLPATGSTNSNYESTVSEFPAQHNGGQ